MIERLVVVFAAVIPGFVLLHFWVKKARSDWRDEALWTAFLMGAVCAFAAILVSYPFDALSRTLASPILSALSTAVLAAAIPEESIKFLVVVCIALRHVDARRELDTIVLAIAVSLGFAALENFFYLAEPGKWVPLALVRALTAVPGHALFGLAMGALLTAARLGTENKNLNYALALGIPISLHAAYDFPLMLMDRDDSVDKITVVIIWLSFFIVSAVLAFQGANRLLADAAVADGVSEPGILRGSDTATVVDTPRRSSFAFIRWLLAPLVGVVAAFVTFVIVVIPFGLMFGFAEMKAVSSTGTAIASTIIASSSLTVWAWAASLVAPKEHRRTALVVFSSPLFLLALLLALGTIGEDADLKTLSRMASFWLACAVIAFTAAGARSILSRVMVGEDHRLGVPGKQRLHSALRNQARGCATLLSGDAMKPADRE